MSSCSGPNGDALEFGKAASVIFREARRAREAESELLRANAQLRTDLAHADEGIAALNRRVADLEVALGDLLRWEAGVMSPKLREQARAALAPGAV